MCEAGSEGRSIKNKFSVSHGFQAHCDRKAETLKMPFTNLTQMREVNKLLTFMM
ncbi:hypothetical protein DC3_52290 [Deinococcus cellulosilyticus NBRC 106333 = KACC 11606]|uniref:Uncharacterized protein n=1 Tax=Deinococcus cellulosilyticus (strain DSM 18568 / NBRC 106333 / KACC 11606 / 5516J-15) TaxID=1223518 RepID=A0A511N9T4_DEIC1|nr:hypothetical protein DC3_52290 [Deinococcus cellulosilyticus NBRC 106333 = KACC 11606]